MLLRLIARHRDGKVAEENSRLRSALVEARGDAGRHAASLVRAIKRRDAAEDALVEFRDAIRAAHAALVKDNHRLRECGLLAAADLIEHNINGEGLDFPDAEEAAKHIRQVAAEMADRKVLAR